MNVFANNNINIKNPSKLKDISDNISGYSMFDGEKSEVFCGCGCHKHTNDKILVCPECGKPLLIFEKIGKDARWKASRSFAVVDAEENELNICDVEFVIDGNSLELNNSYTAYFNYVEGCNRIEPGLYCETRPVFHLNDEVKKFLGESITATLLETSRRYGNMSREESLPGFVKLTREGQLGIVFPNLVNLETLKMSNIEDIFYLLWTNPYDIRYMECHDIDELFEIADFDTDIFPSSWDGIRFLDDSVLSYSFPYALANYIRKEIDSGRPVGPDAISLMVSAIQGSETDIDKLVEYLENFDGTFDEAIYKKYRKVD